MLATLCVVDKKPLPNFDQTKLLHLEQCALMVLQELQAWHMWNRVKALEQARARLLTVVKKTQPPTGEATIVRTDIVGSTTLWEKNPIAMQLALEIHDCIIRECLMCHNGYEIANEGDSFHLAFHDPVDAVAFCLKVQLQLYHADWSESILQHDVAAENKQGMFRGLRVRMGVHHGSVSTSSVSGGRVEYTGMTCYVTKHLETRLAHGGQIVTTLETWNLASSLGSKAIGDYQVRSLGKHIIWKGNAMNEGIVAKDIVELVS